MGSAGKRTLNKVSNALTGKLQGLDPDAPSVDIVGAVNLQDQDGMDEEEVKSEDSRIGVRLHGDPGLMTSSPRDPGSDDRFWPDGNDEDESNDQKLLVNFCYEISGELKVKCPEETDEIELVDGLTGALAEIMEISEDQVFVELQGTIVDPI